MTKPLTKEIRQESIFKASLNLLANKGYADTSMEDIAIEADISKANLYYHFKNKKELFVDLSKYYRHQYLEKVQDIIRHASSAQGVLENIFSILDQSNNSFEFLLLSIRDEDIRRDAIDFMEHFQEIIAQVIDLGKQNGEFQTKHNSRELAAYFIRTSEGQKVVSLFTKNNNSEPLNSKKLLHFFLDLLNNKED